MKSTKLVVGGILSIALFLGSCAKEEVTISEDNANVDHTETVRSIAELSNDFVASQERLSEGQNRALPKWLKIVGKDFIGAVGGAIAGSVPGAILGGVGASLVEAVDQGAAAPGVGGGAANGSNEYDFVGAQHVQMLENGLTVDYDVIFDADGLNRAAYLDHARAYLESEGVFTAEEMEPYTLELMNADIDWTIAQGDASMTESIDELHSIGALTTLEYDILFPYVDALTSSVSFGDFYEYSVTAEDIVMGDPDISETSRILLLASMATARHDYNYWAE